MRKVFGPLDPLGVTATSFKAPTEEELRHDFLWRVHRAVPGRGAIGVFNRSHYEDVLVVRVRGLAPESVWRPRYEQINLFERILVENGTVILKFLLHISREEQRERLLARLNDPEKYWKFNANDLAERELWDQYTEAYRERLGADQHGGGTLVRGAGGQQTGPGRAGGPDGRGDAGADGPAMAGAAARARGAPGGAPALRLDPAVRADDDEGERVAQHEERPLGPQVVLQRLHQPRVGAGRRPRRAAWQPVGPPFGGTKLSQSSVYSGLENVKPVGR